MTYRVRIDFSEGDTLWVSSVKEPALLTKDHTKARRVHNTANAKQYIREWEATLELLGLEGTVFSEPYDLAYPVSPRLSPYGREYICDACYRRWHQMNGTSGCVPCREACK